VLFDFDFTLGDSSKAILECIRYALESCDLPVPDEQTMLSTVGMSLNDTFSLLAPGAPLQRLKELFIERGDQVMVDSAWLYDGVPELMSALRDRGYRIGIVTTKFRRRIERILEKGGVTQLVDVIVGFEDVAEPKPDPEPIEVALRRLGCEKESATYVGDSVIDAEAAASAGVKFIAVLTGTTTADELSQHKALAVVNDLTGLLDFFPAVRAPS